jgi:hypothetical protein
LKPVRTTSWASHLKALLALGRLSQLPTVWSNCLAGWWLGGGGDRQSLPFLFAGATCLYLSGAFLNDAFDAEYDRQYHRTRPIPSGAISPDAVLWWGLAWMILGVLALLWLGHIPGGLALALAACILLYNTVHRLVTFSPLLLGLCRVLLYLMAAGTAADGLTGWSIWCGLALGAYVAGVGLIARWENEPPSYWPLPLLAAPLLLALLMDNGAYREDGVLVGAVLLLWMLRCLRPTLWSAERKVGATVSGLVAGIALVDWLAAANAPRDLAMAFIGCFLLTLLLQGFRRVA